jgi:hypothetical protein
MSGTLELKDLVGKHVLTGCQYGTMTETYNWGEETSNTLDFILDGRVLSVIEDPDDGYRSSMRGIVENRDGLIITNTFEPCEVVGIAGTGIEADVIHFYDVVTGKVVISIGTLDIDSYYPCFIAEFNPENMAINNKEAHYGS